MFESPCEYEIAVEETAKKISTVKVKSETLP